jgi:delta14-sterol reductase
MLGWLLFVTMLLFVGGWTLTRGANLQKYYFKLRPTTAFLGVLPPRTIPNTRLLASGFWGLARHVNYLGEILQAVATALPGVYVGSGLVALLYPAYVVALLVSRQLDDERLCAAKYGGGAWSLYKQEVPYRIVPYLY